MKDEERTKVPSWNTTDALEHVDTIIADGVAPVETHYEVDDIIKEFADPSALTPERTGQHIERMERRLQEEEKEEAPAPAPETPKVPAEEADPEETARFVREQVSEAMDEQEQAEAKPSLLKRLANRFLKTRTEETGEQDTPEEQQTHVADRHTPDEESSHDAPEDEESDDYDAEDEVADVISLPKDLFFPVKSFFRDLHDQVTEFADNMYSDARSEGTMSEEADVPGTDEETIPETPVKERKERVHETIPDTSAAALAEQYYTGLRGLGRRTVIVLALSAVILLLSIGAEQGWPLLGKLMLRRRVLTAFLTWGLAVCAALGLDVLWLGISAPFRGRMGLHTLTALSVFVTLIDGLVYVFPQREGPLPLVGISALALGFTMWGAYDRKRALHMACRAVSASSEPYRVTLDNHRWDDSPAFDKVPGTVKDFGRQMQSVDGSIAIARIVSPILLIMALVGGISAAIACGSVPLVSWCLSVVLVSSAPLGALLCYAQPLLRVTRHLDRYGAVLAGWDGAASMTGKAGFLIKDNDLFPVGTVSIADSRFYGDAPEEQVVACTASILRKAGCTLSKPFEDQLKLQGGFLRPVEDLEWNESGGFTATIRGQKVILARESLMKLLHITIPPAASVRSAMYVAIDGQLAGMFKLQYSLPYYVVPSLVGLLREKLVLVLATRDFNITPGMLAGLKTSDSRNEGSVPTQKMEYPVSNRRRELSDPNQHHSRVLGALVFREGIGAYADTVLCGRSLVRVTHISTIITLIESLLGIIFTVYLAGNAVFDTLSAATLLPFLLLLFVPNLVLSVNADRF